MINWKQRYAGWSEQGFWKPLPNELDVRPSSIHGNGLFAKEDIPAGRDFGVTHIRGDGRFAEGVIRTPTGAYINHNAETPNCEFYRHGENDMFSSLRAIKPVGKDEELTVKYIAYDPTAASPGIPHGPFLDR